MYIVLTHSTDCLRNVKKITSRADSGAMEGDSAAIARRLHFGAADASTPTPQRASGTTGAAGSRHSNVRAGDNGALASPLGSSYSHGTPARSTHSWGTPLGGTMQSLGPSGSSLSSSLRRPRLRSVLVPSHLTPRSAGQSRSIASTGQHSSGHAPASSGPTRYGVPQGAISHSGAALQPCIHAPTHDACSNLGIGMHHVMRKKHPAPYHASKLARTSIGTAWWCSFYNLVDNAASDWLIIAIICRQTHAHIYRTRIRAYIPQPLQLCLLFRPAPESECGLGRARKTPQTTGRQCPCMARMA